MIEQLLERVTRRLRATAYKSGRRRALGFLTKLTARKTRGRMRRRSGGTLARSSYKFRSWRRW